MAQQAPQGVRPNVPDPETTDTSMEPNESVTAARAKGLRFWAIVAALAASKLMLALEITIVSTALPTIVQTLGVGSSYVWVSNGSALASAAIAPPLGQLSDLFGRRYPTCLSVLLFVVGGIIPGAATSGLQLIAGRVVQGLGAGGINVMSAIVVSDLVSVRHRGKYMAIMLAAYLLGATSGPLLGGVLVQSGAWRWVFWLPVPFGAAGLLVLAVCLKGGTRKANQSRRERLRRVDYGGNVLLTAATGATLYAITYAGSKYPWYDARIVAALTAGTLGLGVFLLLEQYLARSNTVEPVIPLRLLTHRVGATVAAGAFTSSLLSNWVNFLLPLYFQGVRMSTPSRAGVQLLPIVAVAVPASIISVVLSLANIWSVTIPAAVFNNRLEALADRISDERVRDQLGGGRAYGFATRAFLESVQGTTRDEVVRVFGEAIKGVWYVAAGIAGVGVLLACAEGEVVLREELETDFGLEKDATVEVGDKTSN
ncbi:Efflux pump FUS6 [Colletotrichum sp. SAR11_239]|nr:Efflux pump FUS6 [Colletotrichum sp. SAR11_239]